jgi:phage tail-like protein
MAIGQQKYPTTSFRFKVDVQGAVQGSFRECGGLGSETELIEGKESKDGKLVYMKIPGALKWENITLKRGITDSMDVWDWRKKVEEGNVDDARKDGSIVMCDEHGGEIARWNFTSGWPRKVSGPSFNAQNNEIGIEELEIVHEGIIRDH